MAERLLSQFSPQNGLDLRVFLTAIASILMHYPVAVGEEIADPFLGLPSKLKFPPTPYDVKQACDEIAARARPVRCLMDDWDARSRAQLEERKRIEDASRRDPDKAATVRKFEDEMASHGIHMEGWKKRQPTAHGETSQSVRSKLGLTQEQWDALPDAKIPCGAFQSLGEAVGKVVERTVSQEPDQ
jgi:hypothetical protein